MTAAALTQLTLLHGIALVAIWLAAAVGLVMVILDGLRDARGVQRSAWPRRLPLAVVIVLLAVLAVAAGRATAAPAASCYFTTWTADGPYHGDLSRTSRTSCPFARNVFRAFISVAVRAGGAGDGPLSLRTYSPVTRRWYRVRCHANGDLYSSQGMRVACRAGIGAAVAFRAWSYS